MAVILLLLFVPPRGLRGCTIGVAAGAATSDGRPMIWKTRDCSALSSTVRYNVGYGYNYIVMNSDGELSFFYQGLNDQGFGIVNSLAYDLVEGSSGLGNGGLIREALATCATISDFEDLLTATNITGRQTHANYAVIDSTGAAKMIEVSGNNYWVFDAELAPDKYIVRTNFSVTGGGNTGIERFDRSSKLIADFHAGDSLNYKSILRTQMRDFSGDDSEMIPVPFIPIPFFYPTVPMGYICPYYSICRYSSKACTVIQGVLNDESPQLSVMWNILGQPASSVALPYFAVGEVPDEARGTTTCLLSTKANLITESLFEAYYIKSYGVALDFIDTHKLRDSTGAGLWSTTFPLEDTIFQRTSSAIEGWRSADTLPVAEMLTLQSSLAEYAVTGLEDAYSILTTSIIEPENFNSPSTAILLQNYPNPFNPTTTISYDLPQQSLVKLTVFDIRGQQVAILQEDERPPGNYQVQWNGIDQSGNPVSTGVYFGRLQAGDYTKTIKMVYLQ